MMITAGLYCQQVAKINSPLDLEGAEDIVGFFERYDAAQPMESAPAGMESFEEQMRGFKL